MYGRLGSYQPQHRSPPTADQILLVHPASNRLTAYLDSMILLEQQDDPAAGPAGADKAKNERGDNADPAAYRPIQSMLKRDARRPPGVRQASFQEARSPTIDGAAAREQHRRDDRPVPALGQQHQQMGTHVLLMGVGCNEILWARPIV